MQSCFCHYKGTKLVLCNQTFSVVLKNRQAVLYIGLAMFISMKVFSNIECWQNGAIIVQYG